VGYVLYVMLGNAVVFQLTMSPTSDCEAYATEEQCLVDENSVTRESLCYWDPNESVCLYRYFESNVLTFVYLAAVSSLFTAPLTLLQDYLIQHFICPRTAPPAPRETDEHFEKIVNTEVDDARKMSRVNTLLMRLFGGEEMDRAAMDDALVNFDHLAQELSQYRAALLPDSRTELDRIWGLQLTVARRPPDALMKDLRIVHSDVVKESRYMRMDPRSHDVRLLQLFQKDLLPYVAGAALDSKMKRDNVNHIDEVPLWQKALAWSYLCFTNAGILFYIYLFSISVTTSQQTAWLKSFVAWILIDIVILCTLLTYISNVYVPSLFMDDVEIARRRVFKAIDVSDDDHLKPGQAQSQASFNACKYLFVSHRLAQAFPSSHTSKLIAEFSSPWPRRQYGSGTSVKGVLAVVLVTFFEVMFEMPNALQDLISKLLISVLALNVVISSSAVALYGPLIQAVFIIGIIVLLYAISKAIGWMVKSNTIGAETDGGAARHSDKPLSFDPSRTVSSNGTISGPSNSPSSLPNGTVVSNNSNSGVVMTRRRQSAVEGLAVLNEIESYISAKATPASQPSSGSVSSDSVGSNQSADTSTSEESEDNREEYNNSYWGESLSDVSTPSDSTSMAKSHSALRLFPSRGETSRNPEPAQRNAHNNAFGDSRSRQGSIDIEQGKAIKASSLSSDASISHIDRTGRDREFEVDTPSLASQSHKDSHGMPSAKPSSYDERMFTVSSSDPESTEVSSFEEFE
jgi:hypothetical protein